MAKKIIYTAFLLIASVMLLAHEVIPHHHHDDHICFEHTTCDVENTHHGEEKEDSSDKNNNDCCQLADAVVTPPQSQVHEVNCPCCTHDNTTMGRINLSMLPVVGVGNHLLTSCFAFWQNPNQTSFILSLAGRSHGLRAPPIS